MNARIFLVTLSLALGACGGGGDGDSNQSTPPSGLSYPSPQVLTVGHAITQLTPSVTGSVTSYSVNPALPAGLALNTTSGGITGTPTTATAQAVYTVSATNSGGSATAGLTVTVNNDAVPAIAYQKSDFALVAGVPATIAKPASTGGTVVTWSVAPALPAGLTLSASDGSIAGTPTATQTAATYTVTATNSGGPTSAVLHIAVESGVLVDLGHANGLTAARQNSTRVFSLDRTGHWVLWNSQTAVKIAQANSACGDSNCNGPQPYGDLAGTTFALQTTTGLETRSTDDGQVLGTIAATFSWWKLASDGSYICAGDAAGLKVWSTAGAVLFSRAGDYAASSKVFAAPGEIRIAAGPAGANVVETIALASSTATVSPAFQGTFLNWFLDGGSFVSHISNTIWIYSKDSVQLDARALLSIEKIGGWGNWFWVLPGTPQEIRIYEVNSAAAPVTHQFIASSKFITSGATLGLAQASTRTLTVVDLSGVAPAFTDVPLPVPSVDVFAAVSATNWFAGSNEGVLFDGSLPPSTPRFLSYGRASSIAGSPNRIAVATSAGPILTFDAASKTQLDTVVFRSSKVALSTDGAVLAAAKFIGDQTDPGNTLKAFAMPAGTSISTGPGNTLPNVQLVDFSLTSSGQRVGRVSLNPLIAEYTRELGTLDGLSLLWSDTASGAGFQDDKPTAMAMRLSPDGTLVAVADKLRVVPDVATNIVKNGNLVTAVAGWPVGWIDDGRLLVNRYMPNSTGQILFTGSVIVSATGQQLATPDLPDFREFQSLSGDTIYVPELNEILSATSADSLWTTPSPSTGVAAVAGSRVVFASGSTVRAEPF